MPSNEQPVYHWTQRTEPVQLRPVDARFFARISRRASLRPRKLLREMATLRCDVCGKPIRLSRGARLFLWRDSGWRRRGDGGVVPQYQHRRCARLPKWLRTV